MSKKINLSWDDCSFGLDTDGKLKLHIDIVSSEKEIDKKLLVITAFDCLASIAKQEGLDPKEIYAIAFREVKQ